MKKNLIALAVLAASGASFAQVTITGNYTYGFKQSTTASPSSLPAGLLSGAAQITQALSGGTGGNAAGDSSGFGVDTSLVTFTAKEDLGGGMSAVAEMSLDGMARGAANGGDSSLKLTTPVGRVALQYYKPVDYLSGGVSGIGGVGMDNKVFPARSLKESVGFDTKLGPVFVGIAHMEQAGGSAASISGTPGNGAGLGVGAAGSATTVGQRLTSFSVSYLGGPVVANINYLTYDNRTDASNTSYKDVIRTAVSYDFGAFKVAGGVSQLTIMSGATLLDSLVAVSVPVTGALTLSANYANEVANGFTAGSYAGTNLPAAAVDQTRNGYGLSAKYALSKRTSIIASYANWLPFAGASRNNETNLLLSHSF